MKHSERLRSEGFGWEEQRASVIDRAVVDASSVMREVLAG